jgi:polyisoprenoid-binding protein YceI
MTRRGILSERLGAAPLVLLVALGGSAHAAVWVGSGRSGRLAVTVHYQGTPERGRFTRFRVRFLTRKGRPATLTVVVTTASFTLGSPTLDTAARGALWFDTARYPKAVFVARRFHPEEGGLDVDGILRIKGVERPLEFPMILQRKSSTALVLSGRFVVPRVPYRIGTGPWASTDLVGNRVDLAFRVTLVRSGT